MVQRYVIFCNFAIAYGLYLQKTGWIECAYTLACLRAMHIPHIKIQTFNSKPSYAIQNRIQTSQR